MFNKIKHWYEVGLWSASMIHNAVTKGILTQDQADEILGNAA